MKRFLILISILIMLASCAAPAAQTVPAPASTATPQANLPEVTPHAAVTPTMIEPAPATPTAASAAIPTALAIDPNDYQGWWTYTHAVYNFEITLPEDWIVEEDTTNDPLMNDHQLSLHPKGESGNENIRLTFRRAGESTLLWPTGVGQGEFIPQGELDLAGGPVQRVLLVCPSGEVTSIWYHQADDQPNITRGDLEFGVIFRGSASHCEAGRSLNGKAQLTGEMIIASLKAL